MRTRIIQLFAILLLATSLNANDYIGEIVFSNKPITSEKYNGSNAITKATLDQPIYARLYFKEGLCIKEAQADPYQKFAVFNFFINDQYMRDFKLKLSEEESAKNYFDIEILPDFKHVTQRWDSYGWTIPETFIHSINESSNKISLDFGSRWGKYNLQIEYDKAAHEKLKSLKEKYKQAVIYADAKKAKLPQPLFVNKKLSAALKKAVERDPDIRAKPLLAILVDNWYIEYNDVSGIPYANCLVARIIYELEDDLCESRLVKFERPYLGGGKYGKLQLGGDLDQEDVYITRDRLDVWENKKPKSNQDISMGNNAGADEDESYASTESKKGFSFFRFLFKLSLIGGLVFAFMKRELIVEFYKNNLKKFVKR